MKKPNCCISVVAFGRFCVRSNSSWSVLHQQEPTDLSSRKTRNSYLLTNIHFHIMGGFFKNSIFTVGKEEEEGGDSNRPRNRNTNSRGKRDIPEWDEKLLRVKRQAQVRERQTTGAFTLNYFPCSCQV